MESKKHMQSETYNGLTVWTPPKMEPPLLQELYLPDPWKVLVICVFLNCTQRKQVEPMIDAFFARYPTPESYVGSYEHEQSRADIVDLIRPLGFYNRRAKRLYQMSVDFVSKGLSNVRELHGVGEYAARCYEMLFLGKFGDTPPDDHALTHYWEFCRESGVH